MHPESIAMPSSDQDERPVNALTESFAVARYGFDDYRDTRSNEASEAYWSDMLRLNESSVQHVPRATPALDWDTAKAKGEHLLCLLRSSADEVEQSQWTDFMQLQEYGWDLGPADHVYPNSSSTYDLKAAFTDPDVNIDPDDLFNMRTTIKHNKAFTVDGKTWQPTKSEYINVFTVGPDRGSIVAAHNKQGQPSGSGEDAVPLQQWSDIVFLQWWKFQTSRGYADKYLPMLKFIFRLSVETATTNDVIQQAMAGEAVGPWPGTSFSMETDEGKAILGTPHGAGVSWMLIQHKIDLGVKVVSKVTVFSSAGQKKSNLCFWLEDRKYNEEPDDTGEDIQRRLDNVATSSILENSKL